MKREMAERRKLGKRVYAGSAVSAGAGDSGHSGDPPFLRSSSHLPVRCDRLGISSRFYRPARSPFKLPSRFADGSPCVSKLIGATDNAVAASVPKRSLSMVDLSAQPPTTELRLESRDSSTPAEIGDGMWFDPGAVKLTNRENWPKKDWPPDKSAAATTTTSTATTTSAAAASTICHVLLLNAWRCRRDEVHELRGRIEQLGQQQEHLHLRIVVLRRLLESENQRVGRISGEMHRTNVRLDEAVRQRDALRMGKEKAEAEASRLAEVAEERSVKAENLRNELVTAREQLEALDRQIARDREKLLKLREDRRILLDKVSASEALAGDRARRAERAETAAEELQARLAAQIALLDSAQQRSQRLSKKLETKEEEIATLRKELCAKEEREKTLTLHALTLQATCDSQTSELRELRERLQRQSQEGSWSARMLHLAGSVVRAPSLILRTLSFLSTANVPLPP